MSTTETATGSRPPAWHPDPAGRYRMRWWDGAEWTDRVVDDDNQVQSDPPLRSAPATEAPTERPADAVETRADDGADDERPQDPLAGFDQLGKKRLPPEERPTTGAALDAAPSRRGLILAVAGVVVVLASVWWGMTNHSSAERWRDRGVALQEELETQTSNLDALERSLGSAASRNARAADDAEQIQELRGATEATVDQLYQCASALNDVLAVAGAGDPVGAINRANDVCGSAAVNGETLIAILDELERS